MAHIDYYFSTVSPYTYLAGKRPFELAAACGATMVLKPVDIMALFARTGGVPVPERHRSRQEYRLQDLQRRARRLGVPLDPRPMYFPTNAAPPSYAIIAAQKAGGGDPGDLVQAITRACWAEEKDIAEGAVIKAALEEAGYDPGLSDSGLLFGAETYARNLEEAVAAGVFGAPFWITGDDQRFWGEDRLDDLSTWLEEHA